MSTRPGISRHRIGAVLLLSAVATGVLSPSPAHADTVGQGPNGQRLTVAKTAGISRAGETITVSGSGYDTNKGIYVAFCVDNGKGALPSPCGGGADTSGSSGASQWVSSNPPSYGEGLAIPYGPNGTFRVQIRVSATIGDIDCTVRRCAVATRSDHTRSSDRTQDVLVPVSFAATPGSGTGTTTGPTPSRTGAATTRPGTGPTTPAAPGAVGVPSAGTPATGTAATGAVDGPGAGDPAAAGPIEVTRVSESTSTGRLWTGALAVVAAALVGVLLLRRRNRRGAA
ncbi:hypothetical protein OG792_14750 [Micromonospora sp. NBC_01699]|uniref:hypothetical protein n=1 Tax=Micromonospora sp. NBC_01699 TaxID=2975984 RepID=UPI002E2FD661|nr:hypothetical protein [Micromonospora sp. NBC_01699]